MSPVEGIYDFAYRGQLAEEALDREGRPHPKLGLLDEDIAERVSLRQLDDVFVEQAQRMATVYTAIAAFENTVRDLVRRVLLEDAGADWWETKVYAAVQKRAAGRQEEEAKHRFHTQRGDDPISFIEFGDLLNVMRANEAAFAPFWPSPEWARGIFDAVERSRNVIMTAASSTPRTLSASA